MRNIFKYSAVAFAALIAAACQHELSDLSVAGEETIVKFTVNAPAGMQTKADEVPESKVNRLYVEVYTDEACTELYSSEVVEGEQTGWNLEMSVLKGHTYHMLLVAGCYGYFEYNETESRFNKGIKMKYSAQEGSEENGNGNMEEHDLFVAKTSFTSETAGGTITLTRPLAQINIYANDLKNQALEGKITLKKQSVTISNIADVHYPVTGTSSETGNEATFMTTDSYTEDGRVLMCYVLPVNDGNQRLVDISLALDFDYDGLTGQHLDYDIPNVPIQKNHRTNIYGNLYCEQAEFTFTLDSFEDVKDVELWDGTSSEPPLVDSDEDGDDDTYLLSSAEHLAWIRDLVNGNLSQTRAEAGNSLADYTIKLEQDIDLSGKEWKPIGYGTGQNNSFKGTFDGNSHTIRNFKITGRHNNSPQAALFGTVGGATIKNLIIENASVTYTLDGGDFYAAGVAGSVYGATFDNIIVRNSSFEGNNKVAGIFAHEDAGTLVEVNNCHVINCTLRSIDSNDGGNVGGIAGVLSGSGDHRFSDSSVENCTIFGHNPDNTGKRSNGEFVANIGKQNSTIHIDDCEIKGNTFEQAENVTYISPYGPLVGGIREESFKETCKVYIDGLNMINITKAEGDDATATQEVQNQFNTAVTVNKSMVLLPEGTYDIPKSIGDDVMIHGSKNTILTIQSGQINGVDNLTIEGVTLSCNMGTYNGFTESNGHVYRQCTINGDFFCYNQSARFEDCTFNLNIGNYLWTYCCNVEFIRCDFNCIDGKGVLVYNEGVNVNVKFDTCHFKADKGAQTGNQQNIAAIEISNHENNPIFNVTIDNCTSDGGFEYVDKLWRIKDEAYINSTTGNITVTVDGIVQEL